MCGGAKSRHAESRRIVGDDRDVPGTGFRVFDHLRDGGVFDECNRHTRLV